MSKDIELEKTFLLRCLPAEIADIKPSHILDIYIPGNSIDHPHLRLRQKNQEYFITKKYPAQNGNATKQIEITIPLNEDEFKAMRNSSAAKVEKLRYSVNINGRKADVDIFQGELYGLAMVDFEFANVEEMNQFQIPKIALCDVSNEEFLAGGLLAGKKYSEIEPKLKKLGYKSL